MKKLAAAAMGLLLPLSLFALDAATSKNEKVEVGSNVVSELSNPKGKKVFVVGDSTVSPFDDPYYRPRFGYGTKIQDYLNDGKVEVVNLAQSGRSSKSFLTESNYQVLKNNIKKGDYLVVGFGHNDEKKDDPARFTSANGSKEEAGSFKNVLYENYVKLAQSKKATVILCTPIVRRAPGKAYEGSYVHVTEDGDYPQAIRDLAAETKSILVDLTAITKARYEKVGDAETIKFHAWTSDKEKSVDNTHLNSYGAAMVAYDLVQSAASQDKGFKKLLAKGLKAPTDALFVLTVNPNYVIPKYTEFDDSMKSENFKTTAPWYGTVFGDCGGGEKITNPDLFEIVEKSAGNVSMHSGSKDGKTSAGKIASGSDGLAFYFQKIPADKDFTISATATVNTVASNNQVSFGIMVRDDVYIDTYDNAVCTDYVAAGALKIKAEPITAGFRRQDGGLEENKATAEAAPKAGTKVDLSITKKGNSYTLKYGKDTVTYEAKLTNVDAKNVYAGVYTVRAAYVDFSNVKVQMN